MTVAYALDVATSTIFTQIRVLLRWKGSVWKATWIELIIWLIMYFILSVIYRIMLNKWQREVFEKLCTFFDTFSVFIPVTFMLGFYVTIVYNRWSRVFDNVGWIDTSALTIAQYIRGTSERARIIRRNCVRYLIVAQCLVFRDVSPPIRKRFPTLNHLVEAGLLSKEELEEFDSIKSPQSKYWQPIQWLFCLVTQAREEGMIDNYFLYVDLIEKMRDFRTKILNLIIFDMVPIPLVYTQVVNLAVRMYFVLALFGRQFLDEDKNIPGAKFKIDLYFPIMTSLQIIFIIGWHKVSEVMLNPLGEDDEDFETHWIIERNLQVGYAVVDQAYDRCPPIVRDPFWEEETPQPMDTPGSQRKDTSHMQGSCIAMDATNMDNGMISYIRRRSSSISDISRMTESTRTNGSFARRRLSNAFSRIYKPNAKKEEDSEPRRASVCVAALDLNRRPSRQSTPDLETGEQVLEVPSVTNGQVNDTPQDVKWFVDEMPIIEEEDDHHHSQAHNSASSLRQKLEKIRKPSI
ncbi:unnamed protein product [Caenorhabditis angaria]|uniref:Bestrophin homolog n=1 Tax=Caenorhabditis angaria TaxID=860376 RepID=A0A9P1MWF2_9PELO|nr:unnamed protein product [Caenorhabditis angaria]